MIVAVASGAARRRARGGRLRAPSPRRRPAAARGRPSGRNGRDLHLRRHAAAAAPSRRSGDPGGARRDHAARGHRRARRDRDTSRQHRRRAPRDARRRGRRRGPRRQPRRARRRLPDVDGPLRRADVPVWLNTEWVEADVRITTGFVEPHFFAGFSGGPKMVAPGLAGLETVLTLHDAARIGHPQARWGVTEGNPVHDDVRAARGRDRTSTSRSTSSSTRTSASCGPSAAQLPAMHRARLPRGEADRHAAGPRAIRRRRHVELGLPARSEPLPGRQGHVRRGAGGETRRR